MSKSSIAKSASFRTYTKVSDEDWDWFVTQKPSVQQLWGECMKAERFGEKFYKVDTKLSENSFYEAKKALEGARFEFQPIQKLTKNGRYKITGWKVRNLHGSNIHEYWNTGCSLVPQNLREESNIEGETDDKSSTTSFKVNYHKNQGELPQNLGEEKPVALDTTAFDSSLLSTYNLLLSNEQENLSSLDRSGRLEQDPFTKVTGSAPSPGAKLTREENPEAKPTCSESLKKDLEHGLKGELGRQKDNLPVQKMTDLRGNKDTPPPHDETRQIESPHVTTSDSPLKPPQTLPDPWDTQSQPKPTKPAPQPQKTANQNPYIEAARKLVEAGLVSSYSDKILGIFQMALDGEVLVPVTKWYGARGETLPDNVLYSEYLIYNPKEHTEPHACFRSPGAGKLILVPWSELPSL
jgi:hypothetical protein